MTSLSPLAFGEYLEAALAQSRDSLNQARLRYRAMRRLNRVCSASEGAGIAKVLTHVKDRDVRRQGFALYKDLHACTNLIKNFSASKARNLFARVSKMKDLNSYQKAEAMLTGYNLPAGIKSYILSEFPHQAMRVTGELDDCGEFSKLQKAIYDKHGNLTELTKNNEIYLIARLTDLGDNSTRELAAEMARDLMKALLKRHLHSDDNQTALDAFARQDDLDRRVLELENQRYGHDKSLVKILPEQDRLKPKYLSGLNDALKDARKVYVWQSLAEGEVKQASGLARIVNGAKGVIVQVWQDDKVVEFSNKSPAQTIHINRLDARRT